ncbi:BLUF domain-containing protein [Brevundimonas sp.]|uniref:BLUF domain-containing protein n=1 Tax=Brevundimonas sp. TaxID=1871086 RepID=UPI0035ADA4A7
MNSGLERLVYESRATGSTGSLVNLATILAESQRNNDRDGLTGALAAHNERYVQVIEGRPASLDNLLRRLQSDPRHCELHIIDREPIRERLFDGWSMASARITPAQGDALDHLKQRGELTAQQTIRILLDALNPPAAN